jgi:hypothetical protein
MIKVKPGNGASENCVMTIDEYYGAVRRLGLMPSRVPHVYVSSTGEVQNVPDPANRLPEQRREIIEKLKLMFGIYSSENDTE